MKTFNSIEKLKPYYRKETNTYIFNDDVTFNFDLIVDSNIDARNIDAYDIEALNIDAYNIDARNIDAYDIEALNIDAYNIEALNIDAYNIEALNISYYAFCIVYQSFTCESVKGRRDNSIHTCLDGDIVIRKPRKHVTLELTDEQIEKIKELLKHKKNHNGEI